MSYVSLYVSIITLNINGLSYSIKEYAAATAAKSLQSCPTLRPHRQQLTRLPRPWDSPGKNTEITLTESEHCLSFMNI